MGILLNVHNYFGEFANHQKDLVTHMCVVAGFEKLSFREVSEQTVTAL
jgi:hypothetical protein